MSKARRWSVALIALAALLLLVGCDGVTGEVTFGFNQNGSIKQQVEVDGVSLADGDLADLEKAGWDIENSDDGFSASRDCTNAAEFGDGQSSLVRAMFQGADRDATPAETKLKHSTTDYFFVQRHDVEVALPRLDLEPDECSYCGGDGTTTCPDCAGAGSQTCSDCNGAGGETCSDCNGAGAEACSDCGGDGVLEDSFWGDSDCWTCDGTGRAECWTCDGDGRLECWTCDGVGSLDCWTCDASGEVYCDQCGGSGEPTEADITAYEDALDNSSLLVKVDMPGLVFAKRDTLAWEFEGNDVKKLDSLTASSWVVDWMKTGIALVLIAMVLALLVWLTVRSIRRALADARAKRGAKKATTAVATPVVTAASPVATESGAAPGSGVKFCRACGAMIGESSQFCRSCGTATSTETKSEVS